MNVNPTVRLGDEIMVDGKPAVVTSAVWEDDTLEVMHQGRPQRLHKSRLAFPGQDGAGAGDDPFRKLITYMESMVIAFEKTAQQATERAATRTGQVRRLRKALSVLTGETRKGASHEWTPEQRAAAAERMRARNLAKSQGSAAAS